MAIPDLFVSCFNYDFLLAVVCIVFNPFYWNAVCLSAAACEQSKSGNITA